MPTFCAIAFIHGYAPKLWRVNGGEKRKKVATAGIARRVGKDLRMSEKYEGSAFTGFLGLAMFLTIIFLWCKMAGIVDWGWGLILAPLWMGALGLVIVVAGVFAFAPHDYDGE
jgi:hypothetical protein